MHAHDESCGRVGFIGHPGDHHGEVLALWQLVDVLEKTDLFYLFPFGRFIWDIFSGVCGNDARTHVISFICLSCLGGHHIHTKIYFKSAPVCTQTNRKTLRSGGCHGATGISTHGNGRWQL
jgi:hypothetical protein